MQGQLRIDGEVFANMLKAGALNLRLHEKEVNDLNVFPIPDGDTGSNMLMTIMGGVEALNFDSRDISAISRKAADGMLLSARGNSGVILSQLFDGFAKGFTSLGSANIAQIYRAFQEGVKCAYKSVIEPTEGTILTVARLPLEGAVCESESSVEELFSKYVQEAKRILKKTPDMLPVLKRAGVVDSGGAGLIYIFEGMCKLLSGALDDDTLEFEGSQEKKVSAVNLDLFTEDDVLEYGYCTEVLVRLQNSKTDVKAFDITTVTDYLKTVGDSVVAFKTGSIVKIHVHTETPDKVLAFCRKYGEFLTVKIENMSIQHNEVVERERDDIPRKTYAVVAVCSGEGVKQMFLDGGADVIVEGGQCMNPSTEDFLEAFEKVNAQTIFVLPNNGNVILAAQQAANIYEKSKVMVLNSKTIGDGYSALAMMNPDEENESVLFNEMTDAMEGVITAKISRSVRDSSLSGELVEKGNFVGFKDKEIIAYSKDRVEVLLKTLEAVSFSRYDSCIVIRGKDVLNDGENIEELLASIYKRKEFYFIDGMQDIYDYVLIIQ